jgi:hypothetical protein
MTNKRGVCSVKLDIGQVAAGAQQEREEPRKLPPVQGALFMEDHPRISEP